MKFIFFISFIFFSCNKIENSKINNYSFNVAFNINTSMCSGFKYSVLEKYYKLNYLKNFKFITSSSINQYLKLYYNILNGLIKETKNFQYPYGILKSAIIGETQIKNYKPHISRKVRVDLNARMETVLKQSLYNRNNYFDKNKIVKLCLKNDWYYCFILFEYNPDLDLKQVRMLLKYFKSNNHNYFRLNIINAIVSKTIKDIIIKENPDYIQLLMKYGYNMLIVFDELNIIINENRHLIYKNKHALYTLFYLDVLYFKETGKQRYFNNVNTSIYKKVFKNTIDSNIKYSSFIKHLTFLESTKDFFTYCNTLNYYRNSIEIINDYFISLFEGNLKFNSLKINYIDLCNTYYGKMYTFCSQIKSALKMSEYRKRCLNKTINLRFYIDLDINKLSNDSY